MKTIKEVLQQRDEMENEEAEALIKQAQNELYRNLEAGNIEAAYNTCETYFGLEPDYLIELMLT